MQNNIQIKREVLQAQKARKDKTQAYLNIAPSLYGQVRHSYVDGFDFNQYTLEFEKYAFQSGSFGLSGQLNLFRGLNNWNYIAKTKFDLLAALEGVEELKRNVALNIAAKYLEILYANENYQLATKRLETANKQVEKVENQYRIGNVAYTELLQIKSQAINEKVLQTNARNTLEMAYLDLVQMLELSTNEGFEIKTDNISIGKDSINQGVDRYFQDALTTMPGMRIAEYRYRSAGKSYNMALGGLSPTLSLSYQVGSSYSEKALILDDQGKKLEYPDYTFRDQAKDNVQKYIALQLNIPIFQNWTTATRISKAKIDVLDAQYALEEAEKTLLKRIQQAYAEAQADYYRYHSMLEAEASFREVFEMSEQKLGLGMINVIDYGVARDNFTKAQGDLLHAKYSYILKLKILDFYRGIPITL